MSVQMIKPCMFLFFTRARNQPTQFIFRYLCGTEEGLIHRCSVSYNEQYLDTYSGHTVKLEKLISMVLNEFFY